MKDLSFKIITKSSPETREEFLVDFYQQSLSTPQKEKKCSRLTSYWRKANNNNF